MRDGQILTGELLQGTRNPFPTELSWSISGLTESTLSFPKMLTKVTIINV